MKDDSNGPADLPEEKRAFAQKYSELLSMAGFPDAHGRFAKLSRTIGGSPNTHKNRCLEGFMPKSMSAFRNEVEKLLEFVRDISSEKYDLDAIIAWLTHVDAMKPNPQADNDIDAIRDAAGRLLDSLLLQKFIDSSTLPHADLTEMQDFFLDVSLCAVDSNAEESLAQQLMTNKSVMRLFQRHVDNYTEALEKTKNKVIPLEAKQS